MGGSSGTAADGSGGERGAELAPFAEAPRRLYDAGEELRTLESGLGAVEGRGGRVAHVDKEPEVAKRAAQPKVGGQPPLQSRATLRVLLMMMSMRMRMWRMLLRVAVLGDGGGCVGRREWRLQRNLIAVERSGEPAVRLVLERLLRESAARSDRSGRLPLPLHACNGEEAIGFVRLQIGRVQQGGVVRRRQLTRVHAGAVKMPCSGRLSSCVSANVSR